MIQQSLKLKLTVKQINTLNEWFLILTGVWNFSIRKIELDANNKIYHTANEFSAIVNGHGEKIGIPNHVLKSVLLNGYNTWSKCFKKKIRKPRLKGNRNKLNSIPFPDPIRVSKKYKNRISIPGIGLVKYHKQAILGTNIKCGRIIKKASGWYLSLVIDTTPSYIPIISNKCVGIDPGFKTLLTLSTGEKIDNPKELQKISKRLGQAQRGKNRRLVSRIHERIKNKRQDRNHKLSRKLVSENKLICIAKDNSKKLSKTFGKSVYSSSIGDLRKKLAYKCRIGGRQYIEVPPEFTTMTCSSCGVLSGPKGMSGLAVRQWNCACGAQHDRDINAACNVLRVGTGIFLEMSGV